MYWKRNQSIPKDMFPSYDYVLTIDVSESGSTKERKQGFISSVRTRKSTLFANKFHSQCITLANGDWDQSFPIPQEVKSEISHWLTVLNQWNGKEISLFPS
ncbi:hypothetical protein ACTFIY_005010 [Dictyostelium cf. discoideum]